MTLAKLIVGASSSQTCSLLLRQQEARALLALLSPQLLGYNVTM